jgi:hypothetical protein
MLKSKITKQVKQELKEILDQYGYWSDETREFLTQFDYYTRNKLHVTSQVYSKYGYGL